MIIGRYWYVTCYIIVFMLMPFVNSLINKLNKKQCATLCIVLFFTLSLVPSLVNIDFFATKNGYSSLWLVTLYIFGAVYSKMDKKFFGKWSGIIIIVCNILVFLNNIALHYAFNIDSNYLINYTSPFIVIASIFTIQIFSKCNFKVKHTKLLIISSTAAFDVYILHAHLLVFDNLINDNFKWILNLPTISMPILIIICAIGIYILGLLTYLFRTWLFKLLKIDRLLKIISKPFDRLFLNGF